MISLIRPITEKEKRMKQRAPFWDNVKGILIFLVVLGHFLYAYANDLPESTAAHIYIFIYSFHMPVFIFCSGYFSKSERSRSSESLMKLILCYLVFNTGMLVFAWFFLGTKPKLLTPYYSYWYILSMLVWRSLIGKLGNVKGILILTVLISLAMGYSKEFTNLLSIRRSVAFFPFFVAGYLMDREKVDRFLARRKPWLMVLSSVAVLAAAAAVFWAVDRVRLTESAALMSAYSKSSTVWHRLLIFVISAVALGGMFLTVPDRHIPLLTKSGEHSLLIYLIHRAITIVYYKKLFPVKTYSQEYLLYALIATVAVCWIFSREPLNRLFTSALDRSAAAVCRGGKAGKWILGLILLGFLGVLIFEARTA